MDDDLYDEFGNYIGSASEEGSDDELVAPTPSNDLDQYLDSDDEQVEDHQEPDDSVSQSIVLHEDKQYYADARDVYGRDVETVTYEQDTESLSQPIIAPVDTKTFSIEEQNLPEVFYDRQFQADLMSFPDQLRNVAIVGHLNHGKTAFLDMLVEQTHNIPAREGKKEDLQLRYTDTHVLEVERGLTLHCSPISLLLENSTGKSHLVNIVDTPGHVDFIDEVTIASRLADGFVVVVDVVEGLMVNTERVLAKAILDDIPFVLVLNKIDRLILELKLPPDEAYYKIVHVLDTINQFILKNSPTKNRRVSPELGNVIFASASLNWCFSLKSFAKFYKDWYPKLDLEAFTARLWGNIYFDPESNKFSKLSAHGPRAFVHFILSPIYKIISYTISYDEQLLKPLLTTLGIKLKSSAFKLNAKPLLKLIFGQFFGNSSSFVDIILKFIPSPADAAATSIARSYTGDLDSEVIESANNCNSNGPLLIDFVKLFPSNDAKQFYALGRVHSGTLSVGDRVSVLGESYSADDDEDMAVATVSDLWIYQSRYKIPVNAVPSGNWVLVSGIDRTIVKTATVVGERVGEDVSIFRPLKLIGQPVFKVAVEPVNPSELPRMLNGLRSITKAYAMVSTKVEDSGEHIILGTGEMYMDSIMYDLRNLYSDIAIKVSDPVTKFSETCLDMSAIKCPAETPNKRSKITIVAEPLNGEISDDIENGRVDITWPTKKISQVFQDKYDWDLLASRSIWAFGPDNNSPNILQDDTLPSEVDKKLVASVRESIKQGFIWCTREGPLCEEPIRGATFKLIDAQLAKEPIYRGGGQIIPTARRACYSSFLLASPRLLEPVYKCRAICSANSVPIVYDLLARRRGNVTSDVAIPGTPLYSVEGTIPVIDSFGFETDVRIATQGSASLSLVFDSWELVPGDPLDRSQHTLPLKSAPPQGLARDFVLKTRRRKGLSEEPTIMKYLDSHVVESLRESGLLDL